MLHARSGAHFQRRERSLTNVATASSPGERDANSSWPRNLFPAFVFKPNEPELALRPKESGVNHMKSNSRTALSRISALRIPRMSIALLMLALPLPALAALGGDVASVHEDQAQMKGTLKTTQAGTYTVHEIKASVNTVVKEYVSPAGKVFAITWRGQFIPDMHQLLGTYFDQYLEAGKAQRENHVGRHALNIQQPGFVFQNGGHMRLYFGRAYAPEMVPQAVNVDALQ
jgi:hypothetical protein